MAQVGFETVAELITNHDAPNTQLRFRLTTAKKIVIYKSIRVCAEGGGLGVKKNLLED